MGSFKLGKMTLGGLFKKPETLMYPVETKTPPAGLKGHVVNDVRPMHPVRHLPEALPLRRNRSGQAGAHLDHRPLPLRAVRQLRARMPEGLPDHGAHVHAAGDEQARRLLRGSGDQENGVRRVPSELRRPGSPDGSRVFFRFRPRGYSSSCTLLSTRCGHMDPFRLTKACMNQTNAPEGNSLAVVARGARANGNPVEDVNKDGVLGKPARMVQIGTRSTGPERMARFLRRETARKGRMLVWDRRMRAAQPTR